MGDSVTSEHSDLADTYRHMQLVVGVIAITLPFVIWIGDWIITAITAADDSVTQPRSSMSAYYYARTGGWFVGSLFALAVFFWSYERTPRPGRAGDNAMSKIATVAALGVALFPTSSGTAMTTSSSERWVGAVHFASAAVLFVVLGLFSSYQFTKSAADANRRTLRQHLARMFGSGAGDAERLGAKKAARNRVFRICGAIIFGCVIAAIAERQIESIEALFWIESVAVVAFGVSWFVKSGLVPTLLDD